MKYEYKVESLSYMGNLDAKDHLNKLGADGWEAFSITTDGVYTTAYLLRVLP